MVAFVTPFSLIKKWGNGILINEKSNGTSIVSESTSGIEIKFPLFTDITQAAQ